MGADDKFTEEVAQVFGVPFEVIPFKANPQGAAPPPPKRHHIHAIPGKAGFEIKYPRVEGYTQAIRNRVAAVNADGTYGTWKYGIAHKPTEVSKLISEAANVAG